MRTKVSFLFILLTCHCLARTNRLSSAQIQVHTYIFQCTLGNSVYYNTTNAHRNGVINLQNSVNLKHSMVLFF